MNTDKFCRNCGSKTEKTPTRFNPKFDHETGERCTVMVCSNYKCEEHCDFHNKHKWGSFFKLQSETCQICGYVVWFY